MYNEIPQNSIKIQEGLYLHEYDKIIGSNIYTFRNLYAAEGYCFYDISQPENYELESNELLPEDERMYMCYMSCAYDSIEEINNNIISVIKKETYEIV